ncbi:hypothetical protein EG327_008006, partial [Venturia inaequalis]
MFAAGSIRKVSFRFSTDFSRRLLTSKADTIKPWAPVAVRPQNPVVDDPPSDPKGVTGILSNWVKDVQLNDIPKELIERSKHILLDGIANIATECRAFEWNSTYIQGFELDDLHKDAPWHACSVIIPALFAAIEHDSGTSSTKHTGASFLLSAIVGFELGGRIGRALHGTDMLSRGWHSGAIFGPPAAAAAASKQLGLSPRQIEDSFGTACTQSAGLMSAQFEAMAKPMQHGLASRNGLFAALLSRDDYTGIDKVFERHYGGYLDMFSQGTKLAPQNKPHEVIQELGEDWSSLRNISIKPYASMAGTHGPTDCIRNLQENHPRHFQDPTQIKKVNVVQHKAWHGHGGQDITQPTTVLSAQMSTKYCVAAQLLDHAVLPAQFSTANLNRDQIWHLIAKVECDCDPSLAHSQRWATRVSVHFNDGTCLKGESEGPRTTHNPLSNVEIVEKYRRLADTCIDPARRARIEEMVLDIEGLED